MRFHARSRWSRLLAVVSAALGVVTPSLARIAGPRRPAAARAQPAVALAEPRLRRRLDPGDGGRRGQAAREAQPAPVQAARRAQRRRRARRDRRLLASAVADEADVHRVGDVGRVGEPVHEEVPRLAARRRDRRACPVAVWPGPIDMPTSGWPTSAAADAERRRVVLRVEKPDLGRARRSDSASDVFVSVTRTTANIVVPGGSGAFEVARPLDAVDLDRDVVEHELRPERRHRVDLAVGVGHRAGDRAASTTAGPCSSRRTRRRRRRPSSRQAARTPRAVACRAPHASASSSTWRRSSATDSPSSERKMNPMPTASAASISWRPIENVSARSLGTG